MLNITITLSILENMVFVMCLKNGFTINLPSKLAVSFEEKRGGRSFFIHYPRVLEKKDLDF